MGDFSLTDEQDEDLKQMVQYLNKKDKEYANHIATLKKACFEWGKIKAKKS